MDVAVSGAAGAVGRAICGQLLATRALDQGSRLQLVGRRGGASETGVFGLHIDLLDAYANFAPQIEPILDMARIRADVVLMVAGQTPSDDPRYIASRDEVARANLPLFEEEAQALARFGSGHEIVIIQSNPVELAVDVFARHLGRKRVIGAGSYNDSSRLRREVAESFCDSPWFAGRRPLVTGYMLGEHGPGAVPMWSTLRAQGVTRTDWDEFIAHTRAGRALDSLAQQVAHARDRVGELLSRHQGEAAFAFVSQLPPDARSLVKAWFAHWSGRTSTATAHCVVDIVHELRAGHRIVLPLQVACTEDDWPGEAGVIGLAVDLDPEGWHYSVSLQVPADELQALRDATVSVRQQLIAWQT
ncbi:MAG: lactate/malate family dehydrogenase [Actinomycetales bacterium]